MRARVELSTTALQIYTNALKFVIDTNVPSDKLKEAAKLYANNQLQHIINSLYECSYFDKFTPYEAIQFYSNVQKTINKF